MRLLSVVLALAFLAGPAHAAEVSLRVVAINDFHGNLEPVAGKGGAVALAATLARLKQGHPNTIFVSSGDLIGASPLPSALAHDEPTLALFKHLGLRANAIGNHELDGGIAELRRQEALAGFPFVSANLVDEATGKPAFAPYQIIDVDGVRVAFVGATVRIALKPLEPESVPGLRLDDEAESLNVQATQLRAQHVRVTVALLHEGAGAQDSVIDANGCGALTGRAREIAHALGKEFDLVLSAHTHALYACRFDDRWLTQAGSHGRYLTVADLKVDRGGVRSLDVHNEPVRLLDSDPGDPEVSRLVDEAVRASDRIAGALVGKVPDGRVSASPDGGHGSPLGRLVAQAQLAAGAGQGARLACTNPSSVPRDLVASQPGGVATYADVRNVQPYGNRLKLRRVTGAQLRALIGQQWRAGGTELWLSCSPALEYELDASRQVRPGSLRLNGTPLADDENVLMVVNSYLARGGQGFDALTGSPEAGDAGPDLDALLAWLASKPGL